MFNGRWILRLIYTVQTQQYAMGISSHTVVFEYSRAAFSKARRSQLLPNYCKLFVHLWQFSMDVSEYPQSIHKLYMRIFLYVFS